MKIVKLHSLHYRRQIGEQQMFELLSYEGEQMHGESKTAQ